MTKDFILRKFVNKGTRSRPNFNNAGKYLNYGTWITMVGFSENSGLLA